MILKAQLEYRGYKETEHDLTAQGGPKGTSKILTFLPDWIQSGGLLFSDRDFFQYPCLLGYSVARR